MFFPDGEAYKGEFLKGAYSGHGHLVFSDGEEYTGDFKDGYY